MADNSAGEGAWGEALEILKRLVKRPQFETWFRGMEPVSLSRDRAILAVPNNFLREWILRRYLTQLRKALREATGADPEIEIRIREAGGPPRPPAPAADGAGPGPAG